VELIEVKPIDCVEMRRNFAKTT